LFIAEYFLIAGDRRGEVKAWKGDFGSAGEGDSSCGGN